jgi:predicted Zn-dependent protease
MNGPGEPHGGDVRENVRALIGLHRYEEAAAAARSGLRADPDDPGLATLLAIALCETDDAAGAVDVAQRAVALQPDASWGHQVLGWALYKAGRTAEGADQLAHALALDPHDSESHVMRGEILLEQADQAPRRTGHRNQMIAQAERHAAEAARLEPALAGGYLVHSKVWFARGEPVPAEAWARHGLSVEPDNPVGHQLLGAAAQVRGDTRTAADHYVNAGKLNPRSDTSIKMLRSMRTALPVGGAALFVAIQVASAVGRLAGAVVAAAILAVFAVAAVAYVLGGRWWARRGMSDEARRVLERDRQTHKGFR